MRAIAGMLSLLAGLLAGGAAPAAELGGRPFAPPDAILPMPESWQARGITRPEQVDVALVLDQQLYPALVPLIERYARDHGLKVALQDGTCGLSGGALAEKTADIAGFCCPPGDIDRLPGLRYHTIGIGALALIAHPAVTHADLSQDEARRLFSGKARSWGELPVSGVKPAADTPVHAVSRLHCKARPGHWRLLLDTSNDFAYDIYEVPAITDMIATVANTPGALGYETVWHVARHEPKHRVKLLRIDGHDPRDQDAVASGRYPFYRVFNLTSWGDGPAASDQATALVQWLVAHAGDIDPRYAIIPVQRLRDAGWRLEGDELVGGPDRP